MKIKKHAFRQLCELAKIEINSDAPDAIHIQHPAFYNKVFARGSLSIGDSFIEGLWDCAQLDLMLAKFISLPEQHINRFLLSQPLYLAHNAYEQIKARVFNLQSIKRATLVGKLHYDLETSLYQNMLDSRMQYSCGYWKDATNLEQAQQNKLDLICRKLELQPGMHLLDIGCGWGGLLRYAAEHYGVSGVGITISKEQCTFAQKHCAGLDIDIRLQDYRALDQQFDRIVSVGMFEHVGVKNYARYMQTVRALLKDRSSLFLLHTIGNNTSLSKGNMWLNKYIFPNGMLPSMTQICTAAETKLIAEDWHNFGADYDTTLLCWFDNFTAYWPQIADRLDPKFYRMWKFYLMSCAAYFRERKVQLWQIVYSKQGIAGGYTSIR